jgi:5'-nucleotidase
MRLLVTNDDGIDSVGLHHLVRALAPLGEVVVAAPDREYSGASAAVGALHLMHPEVHRTEMAGATEAWAVSGPPALCVLFARLGAFGGKRFDLVVSGINPGANVGRSVYHSGTVGAALTARTGGISAIAVSQAVTGFGIEGQGWDEMLINQRWESAAEVGAALAAGLLAEPPADPVVLNVNVPNEPVHAIKGWRRTTVGGAPPRAMARVELEPKIGHEGTFLVRMNWGEAVELPGHTDGGAVMEGYVSVSWLSHLTGVDPHDDVAGTTGRALDGLLGA